MLAAAIFLFGVRESTAQGQGPTEPSGQGSAPAKAGWKCVKDKDGIKILDAAGIVAKNFPLKSEVELLSKDHKKVEARYAINSKFDKSRVPWRVQIQDGDVLPNSAGFWTFKSSHVVVANEASIDKEIQLRLYDSQGNLRWEKGGRAEGNKPILSAGQLAQPNWISADGKRFLLIEDNPEAEEYEEGTWISVVDDQGKEIFRTGPYVDVSAWYLTKNGQFGAMDVDTSEKGGQARAFFEVQTGKVAVFKGMLAGFVDESGVVWLRKDGKAIRATNQPFK